MNGNALAWMVGLPLVAGVAAYLVPRRLGAVAKALALSVTAIGLYLAIRVYAGGTTLTVEAPAAWGWPFVTLGSSPAAGPAVLLASAPLARLVLLGAAFLALAMVVYAAGFAPVHSPGAYYANILWAIGATFGVILSADLLVLTILWAFMGIPFFLLINMGKTGADAAAKKTLIVLGGTDSLLIFGLALLWVTTGGTRLGGAGFPVPVTTAAGAVACLCLAAAAFAKAGAMPFHSWVPDAAETAPVPVVALLPASLDKLLGIYLFARVCLDLFVLTTETRVLFVVVGAVTVLAAVMAALVQHNLRRLLGFHAVSQVGYMVLGVATGTAVGVLGALFHMFNNAIYKSCLFLTAGAAERRTRTGDLGRMGGLARSMPVTFAAALVAALAISGVPPLNGFASKWMVYQGLIESRGSLEVVWAVALAAAMFGSALTLASFVKVLHSVFLGQPAARGEGEAEPPGPRPNVLMGAPMAVLAALCLLLGVFATGFPVRDFLMPALAGAGLSGTTEVAPGLWQPGAATGLLLIGVLLGLLILGLSRIKVREDRAYVGGEVGPRAEPFRFPGTEFYRTVSELGGLRTMYRHSEGEWYDLYHLGRRFAFYVTGGLRSLHSGVLLTYLAWCVLGVVALLWLVGG